MHGRGSLEYSDGSSYTGEWRNGVQQGWGILKTKDGTTQVIAADRNYTFFNKLFFLNK